MDSVGKYYDKDGKLISFEEWAIMRTDNEMKRVAKTTLPDGKWISTVWLGMNLGFTVGLESPLIYETMVFPNKDNMSELDIDRYSTLSEAQQGHQAMVEKWSKE